jgi:hypothetical protein
MLPLLGLVDKNGFALYEERRDAWNKGHWFDDGARSAETGNCA